MRAAAVSGVSLAHLRLSVIPSLICSSLSVLPRETERERERRREGAQPRYEIALAAASVLLNY